MVRHIVSINDYISNMKVIPPQRVDDLDSSSSWIKPALDAYGRAAAARKRSSGALVQLEQTQDDREALAVALMRFCAIHQVRLTQPVELMTEEQRHLLQLDDELYIMVRRMLLGMFDLLVAAGLPAGGMAGWKKVQTKFDGAAAETAGAN